MPDSPTSPMYILSAQGLNDGHNSEPEVFRTPRIDFEEHQPLLSETLPFDGEDTKDPDSNQNGTAKHAVKSMLKVPESGSPRRTMRRSKSDQSQSRGSSHSDSTIHSAQTAFRITKTAGSRQKGPTLRRTSSNSVIESRAPPRNTTEARSADLQQRLRPLIRPWRVRRVRTAASVPFQRTTAQSTPGTPVFKWFPVRSYSDPASVPQIKIQSSKRRGKNLPLKPSLKQKSKSAAATPSTGHTTRSHSDSENEDGQKLRRVKTVDFEETVSNKLLSLPLLKVWAEEPKTANGGGTNQSQQRPKAAHRDENDTRRPKAPKSLLSCPGPSTKSRPADTAITRTDVHVVAIAPSWSLEEGVSDNANNNNVQPNTPTMQIVESKAGCYEVIWDDVPPEGDYRSRRRSSASQSLHAASVPRQRSPSASQSPHAPSASSTAAKGLERVNSKLTEWSWIGGDSPSASFKPQIVVFPDDDGRTSQYECAVEDYEDGMVMSAPPNSERTSASVSRYPSHPASTSISRSLSYEGNERESDDSETAITLPTTERKPVPQRKSPQVAPAPIAPIEDVPTRPSYLIGASQKLKKSKKPQDRRLSNITASEASKFRGHRDSVALAHSRIINAGGGTGGSINPERFIHRDSVSMAKKRMQGRDHHQNSNSSSSARDILPVKASPIAEDDDDVSEFAIGDAETSPFPSPSPSATPTMHSAIKGLKDPRAPSMFEQQNSKHRHIRILE